MKKEVLEARLKILMKQYQNTGRIAFYYPRKQTVSLNGMRAIPVKAAIDRMEEVLWPNRPGYEVPKLIL